jgi:hypothetical protein
VTKMSPTKTKLSPAAGYKNVSFLKRPNTFLILFESLDKGSKPFLNILNCFGDILPDVGDISPNGRMKTVTKMSPGLVTKMFLLHGILPSSPAEQGKRIGEKWAGPY